MKIIINSSSMVPIYEQIMDQIKSLFPDRFLSLFSIPLISALYLKPRHKFPFRESSL